MHEGSEREPVVQQRFRQILIHFESSISRALRFTHIQADSDCILKDSVGIEACLPWLMNLLDATPMARRLACAMCLEPGELDMFKMC